MGPGLELGPLPSKYLALAGQGPQLPQGRGGRSPSRQDTLQAEAAQQTCIELVRFAFELGAKGKMLHFIRE